MKMSDLERVNSPTNLVSRSWSQYKPLMMETYNLLSYIEETKWGI